MPKIVIDIDEETYNGIKHGMRNRDDVENIMEQIENNIPLPKGHGDLIDTNELNNFCKEHDVGISAINKELIYDDGKTSRGDTIWKPLLEVLSTIIEADTERSEDEANN